MPCGAGITTDMMKAKSEHEKKFTNVWDWTLMQAGMTKKQAKEWVEMFSGYHDCEHHGFDKEEHDDSESMWSAYHFYHDGKE